MLRRALNHPGAVPRGSRMLVAVSGGADSTALLLGLHSLARELDLSLRAAHLHHGLRGVEADGDLDFVAALCRRLSVPLIAARWDARARMRHRGLSGQAGLRVLRREFLLAAARRSGATAIATAHTADDQLETVLMRLSRGSGARGLAGMSPRHGRWIKPLLEATRYEIETDLRALRQPWREDRSNRDPRYLRNRIRLHVVPALLSALESSASGSRGASASSAFVSPARQDARRARLAQRVAASARALREANRIVERWARRLLLAHGRLGPMRSAIALDVLRAAPAAVRDAALRRLWREIAPPGIGLLHSHLIAVRGLIARRRDGARVELVAGRTARVEGGVLAFTVSSPRATSRAPMAAARDGMVSSAGAAERSRTRDASRARRAKDSASMEPDD